MKKIGLWLLWAWTLCAQAVEAPSCSGLAKSIELPPGYVFTAEDMRTVEEGLRKESPQNQDIIRALLHICGIGFVKDDAKGMEILQSAGERGNAVAVILQAAIYAGGLGGKPDMARSTGLLRNRAEAGMPEVQLALGMLYAQGRHLTRNTDEAEKWFLRAASQGNADAQDELGATYFYLGKYDEALLWLRLATLQDKARARFLLKEIIRTKAVTPEPASPDPEESARERRLRAAVLDGRPESMLALATFLEETAWGQSGQAHGIEVSEGTLGAKAAAQALERRVSERNQEAIAWLVRAMQQGSAAAAFKLGTASWYGGALGLSDERAGLRLIRTAAAQGHPDAVYWLARAYQQGTGLPLRMVAAYALYFRFEWMQSQGALSLASYVPPSDVVLNAQDLRRAQQLVQALAQPGQFLLALDSAVAEGEMR